MPAAYIAEAWARAQRRSWWHSELNDLRGKVGHWALGVMEDAPLWYWVVMIEVPAALTRNAGGRWSWYWLGFAAVLRRPFMPWRRMP